MRTASIEWYIIACARLYLRVDPSSDLAWTRVHVDPSSDLVWIKVRDTLGRLVVTFEPIEATFTVKNVCGGDARTFRRTRDGGVPAAAIRHARKIGWSGWSCDDDVAIARILEAEREIA